MISAFFDVIKKHLAPFANSILIACLSINPSIVTANSEAIELYFPVSSNNMTALSSELRAALEKNGLPEVSIKFADIWHNYQQNIKNGRIGIYFAAPHFSAWAINKHGFLPIARINESSSHVIVAKQSRTDLFELNDLVGHTVCTDKPLNLNYLLTGKLFNKKIAVNTVFITDISTEMRANQSNCDGFALSNHLLVKLITEGVDDYIRLHQSQNQHNYAFVGHPKLDLRKLRRLRTFLLQPDTQEILLPITQLYAKNTQLVKSKKRDYPISYIQDLAPYWN